MITIEKKIYARNIPIYGGDYRGKCPQEGAEQVTVINAVRKVCPQVIHPRNEGERHYRKTMRHKAEGLTTGASDIIIPGCPSFVCELKRKDPTKSHITDEQLDYLEICKQWGAFVCVAFGHQAALEAFAEWLNAHPNR